MEKIPHSLLCGILTLVGPINEIYQLSLVCKEWYRAMKNSFHLGTLKGYNMISKKVWKCRMKFLSQWKLNELNFQGSCLHPSKSFMEVINASQPKILNLSSCHYSDFGSWIYRICNYKMKHRNENSFCKVEELRITNLVQQHYDDYTNTYYPYIDFEYFIKLFPNLKKLYAGNTAASKSQIAFIISGFKQLEFLDLSNCSDLRDIETDSEALNCILSSNLKTLFISVQEPNNAIEVIRNKGIRVVTQNLGEILKNTIEEESTSKLEEWLKHGGDSSLIESKFEERQEWANPLIRLLELNIDMELLEKIVRIMIKSGANLSHEFFSAAISKNMIWLVRLLMNSGCNIWYPGNVEIKFNINGDFRNCVAITSAAKVACETGDFSLLDIFTDEGYHKLNFFENAYLCNPYCIAIMNENTKLFSYLIHKKFSFWKCNEWSNGRPEHQTPLIFHPNILDYAFSSGNFSLDEFPFDWVYDGARYYVSNNELKKSSKLLEKLISWGIKEKEKELVVENKSANICCLYKSIVSLAYNHNEGSKKMLEYLFELGFDSNSVCEHETPLFISASECGDIEMMTFFYEHGAQVNVQDSRGFTALHAASANGHIESVMQLINWGASTSITCNERHTALELAKLHNKINICEVLQDWTPEVEEKVEAKPQKKCAII